MDENTTTTSSLPPVLPPQQGTGQGQRTGPLDGTYAALRRLPARDTDRAVLGGVCATLADRLGVTPVAVRAAAVLSSIFFGVGVGIYLIAWTVLPDRTGRTHLESGLRHGRGRSLLVLTLGVLAAVGVASGALSFIAAILPEMLGVALLAGLGWWLFTHLFDRSRTTS